MALQQDICLVKDFFHTHTSSNAALVHNVRIRKYQG